MGLLPKPAAPEPMQNIGELEAEVGPTGDQFDQTAVERKTQQGLNEGTANLAVGATTAAVVIGANMATDGAINVMTKQLGHVIQRHTIVGTQTANASIFRAGENVVSLIKDAGRVTPTQQANGRLAFVVDAGRAIGYDRASGGPTAFYTVITDAGRNLITAFPGRPGM